MNDRSLDSASQSTAEEQRPAPGNAEANNQQALTQIDRLFSNRLVDPKLITSYVANLRRNANAELGANLDEYLIDQLSCARRACHELEQTHDKLNAELQRLLNPPYYPARYVGPAEWQGDDYAMVVLDGGSRLVALTDRVQTETLSRGDEVYLSHERNAVISKSPRGQAEAGETTTFSRFATDGRLIVSDQGMEVVVTVGAELYTRGLKPGDLLIWDRSARMALGRIDASEAHLFEEIGDTEPPQLGGIDDIRDDALEKFVSRIVHPELASHYGLDDNAERRLLVHGPPGNGKTTLMRTTACELARASGKKCRVAAISGASMYSSYVGETERNTRRCFAALKDHDGPAILFIDEIDAIGRTRGNPSANHDDRFLGTLLAEIEGVQRNDIAIIAATNRPEALDPALRSRFSAEIQLPRPNQSAARQIFAIHLSPELPFAGDRQLPDPRQAVIDTAISRLYDPNSDNKIASLQFRDGQRQEISARDLISGRLIAQISASARTTAFERHCRGGEPGLSIGDMQHAAHAAVERLRRTLSVDNVRSYLSDIPRDLDVVEVEAVRPRVERQRYTRNPSRPVKAPAGGIHA